MMDLGRASPPRRRKEPVPKQQIRLARSVGIDPDWHKSFAALCLMPKGPPLPSLILSKKRLHKTWEGSRDATSKPAKPGLDLQTAIGFAQNLNANIDRLHQDLMDRRFRFASLKAVVIPKGNGKKRVICIPAVRDRLVQRAIMTWLVEKNHIPHQDFVYGIKGQGTRKAIETATRLRGSFDWCIKTDIQSFFDNISRPKLKTLIAKKLKGSSLLPLLFAAVDLETKSRTAQQAEDIKRAGIRSGIGIRQGMPLSPLLANFSLSEFDATCKANNIKILRYADDILAFFHTKAEALQGFEHIEAALKKLELYVPEIGSAKTELVAKGQPVSFLGREIVYLSKEGTYVSRVSNEKLDAIKTSLSNDYSLGKVMDENGTLDDAISSLSASIRSYFGAYKDAHNYAHFESQIKGHYRSIIRGWFGEIFGPEIIEHLSERQQKFLGVQISDVLDPVEDLEITG